MNFSNRDVLTVFYCFITCLGVTFLLFALYTFNQSKIAAEPISFWLATVVLSIMGIVLIMFGLETYIFRDDPDVWR